MNSFPAFFRVDALSSFVAVFVGVFTVLTILYSLEFMRGRKGLAIYYICVLITCAVSIGAVFADNLILFIVFWGFLGLLLYVLVGLGQNDRTSYTAKKSFIIIGGTDAFMLLGIAIVWMLAGQPRLPEFRMESLGVALRSGPAVIAYLCLAAGAFAKAGAMPFHTWVPDAAEDAPTPVTAYLPASLDKLLGIYFFTRLTLEWFDSSRGINVFLMALGSFTIIAAVMMALVQHDTKRLLGYHAVSQVGYMVLGIGTGTAVGIAGGLFHMLNNTIYKSCLFMSAGAVEKRAGTTDLAGLGGYAKAMPVTFITFLVAALAISGVPPLNGFASKWMVYQGVIDAGRNGSGLWVLWLIAAMFGSALTLASFMKLLHAIFLGQPSGDRESVREVGPAMWIPPVVLTALCIVFGIFAFSVPLKYFILPALNLDPVYLGEWRPLLATGLIVTSLVIGLLVYLFGTARKTRTVEPFVGGERLEQFQAMRMSGVDFYKTVQDIGPLRPIYAAAEKKGFDIYEVGTKIAFGFSKVLGFLHNGVLSRYLAWCLLGTMALLYVLLWAR